MHGVDSDLAYDELVVGTGAVPVGRRSTVSTTSGRPMASTCCTRWATRSPLTDTLERIAPRTALIVGAGYVGLEMAEGLTARGIAVTQVEMLPEVLPTVDRELGALVRAELEATRRHRAHQHDGHAHQRAREGQASACTWRDATAERQAIAWDVDLVLVVVGVRPDTDLLTRPAPTLARAALLSSTTRWPPGFRTCGPQETAS